MTSKTRKPRKRAEPTRAVPNRIPPFTRLTARNVATANDFESQHMGIASKE
jgi:hypothetical protein